MDDFDPKIFDDLYFKLSDPETKVCLTAIREKLKVVQYHLDTIKTAYALGKDEQKWKDFLPDGYTPLVVIVSAIYGSCVMTKSALDLTFIVINRICGLGLQEHNLTTSNEEIKNLLLKENGKHEALIKLIDKLRGNDKYQHLKTLRDYITHRYIIKRLERAFDDKENFDFEIQLPTGSDPKKIVTEFPPEALKRLTEISVFAIKDFIEPTLKELSKLLPS